MPVDDESRDLPLSLSRLRQSEEPHQPRSANSKEVEIFDDYKKARSNGCVEEEKEERITGLRSSSEGPPPGISEEAKQDATNRGWLAIGVLSVLGVLIFAHYLAVFIFARNQMDTKPLESVFNTALPVLTGFAGTAFAFYFKDRKK